MVLVRPDPKVVERLRQQSLLHSALYSARIEGNPLSENNRLTGQQRHQLEIQQLVRAYDWLWKKAPKRLTKTVLLKLHEMAMRGLNETAGRFRREQTAIFNQAGVAVYLTPPADEIEIRLRVMLEEVEKDEGPVPVKAALLHIWLEKIHPFTDGNGRVGRLLMALVLYRGGYGFEGLLTVEKIMEQRRSEYYEALSQNTSDVTEFIELMIECLLIAVKEDLKRLKQPVKNPGQSGLLPRQEEILAIIKDHREVSFDFIRRRFLAIPTSTLHYEISQLIKRELVVKLGSTRGARYRAHDQDDAS